MRKIKHILFILICLCLLAISKADLVPKANAVSAMAASEQCIEFIKTVEGFSAKPYYDYSQYTVGYGTKCPDEKYAHYNANGISKAEADTMLRETIVEVGDSLHERLIDKYNLTLTQQQFDALVSFSFNIGTGWTTYDSSLRNAILRNASDSEMVYAFGLYCTAGGKYLPGLITRRLCEANIYLNGIYSKNLSNDFGYVYYDANGGSLTYRVQGFLCNDTPAPAADALKNHDTFMGWYTELNGGSQVTTLTRALTGQTLFARWQSSENAENVGTTSITVKITGDIVNVRSGPGTNYGVVRQIAQNQVVTVSHVTHLTNMKWGKIPEGWICLDYTNYDAVVSGSGSSNTDTGSKPSDEVTVPNEDSAQNNTNTNTSTDTAPDKQNIIQGVVKVNDFLKIRSGPGTTYSTVGFLFSGTKVEILSQKTVGSMVWGQIADGWVCMDYIRTDKEPLDGSGEPQKAPVQESAGKVESTSVTGKITADALRIRSGAGTTYTVVGFYYQNDQVTISEKVLVGSVYWGKTSKGWISMDYVQTDNSSESASTPTNSGTKTIIADCLRIRKNAGTDNKIVGFLYYGDKVTILETKDVAGSVWGRVDKGWINMQYAVDQ